MELKKLPTSAMQGSIFSHYLRNSFIRSGLSYFINLPFQSALFELPVDCILTPSSLVRGISGGYAPFGKMFQF
jgi:hypothetical protein